MALVHTSLHLWMPTNRIVIADIVHTAWEYIAECIISTLHGNS